MRDKEILNALLSFTINYMLEYFSFKFSNGVVVCVSISIAKLYKTKKVNYFQLHLNMSDSCILNVNLTLCF